MQRMQIYLALVLLLSRSAVALLSIPGFRTSNSIRGFASHVSDRSLHATQQSDSEADRDKLRVLTSADFVERSDDGGETAEKLMAFKFSPQITTQKFETLQVNLRF